MERIRIAAATLRGRGNGILQGLAQAILAHRSDTPAPGLLLKNQSGG